MSFEGKRMRSVNEVPRWIKPKYRKKKRKENRKNKFEIGLLLRRRIEKLRGSHSWNEAYPPPYRKVQAALVFRELSIEGEKRISYTSYSDNIHL